MSACGSVVAVLGAESTGKTTLVSELCEALREAGHDAVAIDETLRAFCEREQRTPRREEQMAIAAEQSRRIEAAAACHDLVIADTTTLQTAVYSELVFGDLALYPAAEAWQREHVRLTLLTALDLPWRADGHQRDGEHVREPVDALLRRALQRARVAFSIVTGQASQRRDNALAALRHALGVLAHGAPHPDPAVRWQSVCERCGHPSCERLLATAPAAAPAAGRAAR